jgi:hypothetical protein
MDVSNLEQHMRAIDNRIGKLNAQLRIALFALVGLMAVLACAGAFAFVSLSGTMLQQQKQLMAQRAAMEQPLNDGQPPGPQSQPGKDEDP